MAVRHLEPIKTPAGNKHVDYLLPVSINILRDDLVQSFKDYAAAIEKRSPLQMFFVRSFVQAARMLLLPEPVRGISRHWQLF